VCGATHEAILKPSYEAQNSFWIKNRTGECAGHFPTGPINKAVPSFTNEYVNNDRWYSKHLSLLKKSFALKGVCTVL